MFSAMVFLLLQIVVYPSWMENDCDVDFEAFWVGIDCRADAIRSLVKGYINSW